MAGYTFEISVEGGDISAIGSHLTADSVEYIKTSFSFDESWDTLIKTAIFRTGDLVYHTPLENDCCKIPYEALNEGMLYISVFGIKGTTRATTAELAIYVQNSGYTTCEPSAPSIDPYNYYINIATECKDAAEQSTRIAENASIISTSQAEIAKSEADKSAASATSSKSSAQSSSDSAAAAEVSAQNAAAVVMREVEQHNNDLYGSHTQLLNLATQAKSIALGKATGICFDTKENLNAWIEGTFERDDGKTPEDLNLGDNIYIIDISTPDYWWDGDSIQVLETEKPYLSDHYTKTEIDSKVKNATFEVISRTAYDSAYLSGTLDSGRIYFVFEEVS